MSLPREVLSASVKFDKKRCEIRKKTKTIKMGEPAKLYDIIYDVIDSTECTYYEIVGVLELLKMEIIREIEEIGNQDEV